MKSAKNILIFLSPLLLLLISCESESSTEEKEEAWESYFEGEYEFCDTVMTYTLSPDTLVITFPEYSPSKRWRGSVEICQGDYNGTIVYSSIGSNGRLDDFDLKNGEIEFTGLQLNPDSLSTYLIELFGGPDIKGKEIIPVPFYYVNNMYWDNGSGKLTIRQDLNKVKFYLFNEDALDKLSPELRNYCQERWLKYLEEAVVAAERR